MTWKGPGTTWDGGKSDDADIERARRVLTDRALISPAAILKEPQLLLPRDDAPYAYKPITADEAERIAAETPSYYPADLDVLYMRRHPDLCCSVNGYPRMVVELDGSWHDTVPGRKATDRRDRDYKYSGISCVSIRLSEYPEGWEDVLARRAFRTYWSLSKHRCKPYVDGPLPAGASAEEIEAAAGC